jgi:hypothetical protein
MAAITTKQLGAQLIEWAVEAFVQAATHEANWTAARRQTLSVPSGLLVAAAE